MVYSRNRPQAPYPSRQDYYGGRNYVSPHRGHGFNGRLFILQEEGIRGWNDLSTSERQKHHYRRRHFGQDSFPAVDIRNVKRGFNHYHPPG